MRFWKKKWYKEVPCKACDETGKINNIVVDAFTGKKVREYIGACNRCNGKGSQTVLEREE